MHTLDEWHKTFSAQLEIRRDDENNADLPNGSASLHIAFHAVRILVFRALLRPFNQLNPELTPGDQNSDEWLAARTQIRRSALAEVTSILNLISSFRQEHYQAFWAPCTSYIHCLGRLFTYKYRVENMFRARYKPSATVIGDFKS